VHNPHITEPILSRSMFTFEIPTIQQRALTCIRLLYLQSALVAVRCRSNTSDRFVPASEP